MSQSIYTCLSRSLTCLYYHPLELFFTFFKVWHDMESLLFFQKSQILPNGLSILCVWWPYIYLLIKDHKRHLCCNLIYFCIKSYYCHGRTPDTLRIHRDTKLMNWLRKYIYLRSLSNAWHSSLLFIPLMTFANNELTLLSSQSCSFLRIPECIPLLK